MFETLLESRRLRTGDDGGGSGRRAGAMSLAAHALVTAWATTVWSAGPAGVASSGDPNERAAGYATVRFVRVDVTPASARAAGARAARRRPLPRPAPSASQNVAASAVADVAAIADSVVEEIERLADASGDLAAGPHVEDFGPTTGSGGLAEAVARSLNRGRHGNPFFPDAEFPAVPLADNPVPDYPPALLAAGVGGEVRVRFVIDTTGALDPRTVRVVASTDDRFTRAVRAVLPRLRFLPAESGGTKVPALSEQSFAFVVVLR